MPLDTVWRLARAWYHDRLTPGWRRGTPEEMTALFQKLELREPFWELPAD